jgi:uncharacterized membrane-anchored protein
MGYYSAAAFFGGWILIIATARFVFRANAVFCFWAAYILTRPSVPPAVICCHSR